MFTITALALCGGVLGVLFMVPLRKALIVKEHGVLPYPEGTACADVLLAGEEGGSGAKTVFFGMGMMLGIELDIDVKPVVTALMENGLLVLTAKHKMRLLPPLNIAQTELEKGLSILKNTLAAL